MVIEPMAHWKPLQYYDPGVSAQLCLLFNSLVCEVACCFLRSLLVVRVNGYNGCTNKEKVDHYR